MAKEIIRLCAVCKHLGRGCNSSYNLGLILGWLGWHLAESEMLPHVSPVDAPSVLPSYRVDTYKFLYQYYIYIR